VIVELSDIFEKTSDNGFLLKKPYAEIHIPEDYIDHGIATIIGQEIETFGLFDILVWENEDKEKEKPIKVAVIFPSSIRTIPSRIDRRKVGEDGEYVFEYVRGDSIIKSTQIAKNDSVPRIFMDIIFKGYIPDSIPYEELHSFWEKCNSINGVNLNVADVALEVILAAIARDPIQLEIPFRLALNDKRKHYNGYDRKLVSMSILPKLNSTFAALSSADPKQGITASILRHRNDEDQRISPVEDSIL